MAGHAQLKFVMTECSNTKSLDGAHILMMLIRGSNKELLTPFCTVFFSVSLSGLYVFEVVLMRISMDLSLTYNRFYHILSIFPPNLLA